MADLVPASHATTEDRATPDDGPKLGEWYWVQDTADNRAENRARYERKEWFGCVTHVGSNYVELTSPFEETARVHLDSFDQECSREHNPEPYITKQTEQRQRETRQFMAQVKDLTRLLAVAPDRSLGAHSETQALALRSDSQDPKDYKKALVKAKDKTLPELFEKIKKSNAAVAALLERGEGDVDALCAWRAAEYRTQGVDAKVELVKIPRADGGITYTCRVRLPDGTIEGIQEKMR